jgi:integrase
VDDQNETSSNKPKVWQTTGVEGMYLHGPSGGYYSRFRLNGKRTFRSLDTKLFTAAKLKHEKSRGAREEARQKGADLASDFRTLGQLAKEMERRIEASTTETDTKENQKYRLDRLREHWLPEGSFEKFLVRNVTLSAIIDFRNHLSSRARLQKGGAKVKAKGYRSSVVNQTLTGLRLLLDIAIEHSVIPKNPFKDRAAMQEAVYLPAKSRKPSLPSRADMDRVFEEMLKVPKPDGLPAPLAERLDRMARNVSEHAQFIAYSGMRVSEANAAEIADDMGVRMKVRGTKSESSERIIPVNARLRTLMDQIKARGTSGKFLKVGTSLPAIGRACERLGIPKLTHHDLRHYFATICIEEGVDIPTVSRWLGHKDGGVTAMEVYGHLRDEHSVAAMRKVSFDPRTAQSSGA